MALSPESLINAARNGDREWVEACLLAHLDVNTKGENGTTALHAASSRGYFEIVKLLLDAGADPNAKTDANFTPIMAAARSQNSALISLLIDQSADVSAVDIHGHTPLMCLLSEAGVSQAAQQNCVRTLIRAGATINARSESGSTALMKAAWFGLDEAVRVLLECGADASLVDNTNRTALEIAKQRQHSQIVMMLSPDECRRSRSSLFGRLFRKG